MKKSTLLFLYMVPGTGHEKAAEALIDSIGPLSKSVRCIKMAAVQNTYPVLGEWVNKLYLNLIRRIPFIWDYLYDNPDVERWTRDVRRFLTAASASRTQKILKKVQPNVVVCTQAVAATAMALEKKKKRFTGLLIGVITDFNVHRYWIHSEIDHYLVANNVTKKKLIQNGIKSNRITITGIPIRPAFAKQPSKKRRKQLLIIGGGRGLGSLDTVVLRLLKMKRFYRTTVVCGTNTSLKNKLLKLTKRVEDIRITGYVKNIASIMRETDIVMTKPGGITCSEALAQSCGLILMNPIPGQENRNAYYLKSHGAALVSKKPHQWAQHLESLLTNPTQLKAMQRSAKKVAHPKSSFHGARVILQHLRGRA